jgi:hypothetical protein
MVLRGLVQRQGQVGVDFAQKKPAARLAAQNIAVLADPTQPCLFSEGLFKNGGRVDEYPVAKLSDFRFDAIRQALQAFAQNLVVIAPQGVAGNQRLVSFFEQGFGFEGVLAQIVHARADHPHGSRYEFGRAAASGSVPFHVGHFPVKSIAQPLAQALLVFGKVDIADADFLKTQRFTPGLDPRGEFSQLLAVQAPSPDPGWS